MKHLGKQTFNKIESEDIKTFTANVVDSLNVPLHKSVAGNKFGDVLIEGDTLKIYDNYNISRPITDLYNPDIIKSLLLSEILFDDFFNFDKTLNDSESFNAEINMDTDVIQYSINELNDMTIINDTTALVTILEIDSTNITELYSTLLVYVANSIPIRATFYDNTTYENMIMLYINSISYNNYSNRINMILYDDNPILYDSTIYDIIKIKLETFDLKNVEAEKIYVNLPYHKHIIEELTDLPSVTNNENGYMRLSNNILRLPQSNLTLFNGIGRVYGSSIYKDYIDDIKNINMFTLLIDKSNVISNATYITNEIDLGDASTFEYYVTGLMISFNERLLLKTENNYKAHRDYALTLTDDTTYVDNYLVEIIKFNYNNMFSGEDGTNIDNIVNISYEWIDKNIIDTESYITYNSNIIDSTVIIYGGYYDLNLIQPNVNTIPTLLVQYHNIYKDINDEYQLRIPTVYNNITDDIQLNINKLSKVYLLFDTTSDATIDIYEFDLVLNIYSYVKSVNNVVDIFSLDCGKYKFINNNTTNAYKLLIFK